MASLGNQLGNREKYHAYSIQSTLTHVRGSHTLRAGFEGQQYQYNTAGPGRAAGGFSHNNYYTKADSVVSAPNSGFDYASFLVGIAQSGAVDTNGTYASKDNWYGLFFQDDWRATSRLTLNLGLRYVYNSPVTERHNRVNAGYAFDKPSPISEAALAAYAKAPLDELPVSQFNTMGGAIFAGVDGAPRTFADPDRNNFAPRLGAAYRLGRNTVVKGGYAIYYDSAIGSQSTVGYRYGFSQMTSMIVGKNDGETFNATLLDPFPANLEGGARWMMPSGSSRGLRQELGNWYYFVDRNRKAPFRHRWRIGVEHEVARNMVAEIAYVGSANRDGFVERRLNYLPAQYWEFGNQRNNALETDMTRLVTNPFAGLIPGTGFNNAAIAKHVLLRPYPHMAYLNRLGWNLGRSHYSALESRFEKRMSSGWTVMAAFTKLKLINDTYYPNEFDETPIKMMAVDSRDHRLVVNGIYEIPFGRGRHFALPTPRAGSTCPSAAGKSVQFTRFRAGNPSNGISSSITATSEMFTCPKASGAWTAGSIQRASSRAVLPLPTTCPHLMGLQRSFHRLSPRIFFYLTGGKSSLRLVPWPTELLISTAPA